MNKTVTRAMCLAMGALTAFSVVGCKKKPKTYKNDPETTPLVFSTSTLDGNFNPFFATAAPDVTIASQTQISMLTTDGEEVPVCGEEYPTVALDYTETMKTAGGTVTTTGDTNGTTEYEFLIKNGIKFSDGVELTIKDVLFNLYVYLDPMYSGSSTIYSTKIQGLEAYRQQEPGLSNADGGGLKMQYEDEADAAFLELVDGVADKDISLDNAYLTELKGIYEETLVSDWNSYSGALANYQDEYRFTNVWELFLFVNGVVEIQKTVTDKNIKGTDGKYYTTLDPKQDTCNNYSESDYSDISEAASSANYETNLAAHKAKYPDCTCEGELSKEHVIRDAAIEQVLSSNTTTHSGYYYVLNYTEAGDKLYESILQEKMDAWKKGLGDTLPVQTISGITTYKTKSFNDKTYDEEHDVLKVVIDGVDPKAIWNMAFTVSPMHYYSSAELTAKADGVTNFGVSFADKDFFQNELQKASKNGLPKGAGVYMASNASDSDTIEGKTFYNNNIVYFKRNPYFETVGDGLSNAKIKYMRYKVVASDQIFNSLINKEVHIGEPNATQANVNKVADYSYLGYGRSLTNGYGYVGINPEYVPDIGIRRIIMSAMNTNKIVTDYYTSDLAVSIQRPMSTTSWAYPKGATRHDTIKLDLTKSSIMRKVEELGYSRDSDKDVYQKNGEPLSYTFTIAGETTDHPAYSMFQETATLLNSCGFDITVVTDPNALKKLASGSLEVWAAAWSSTIDPDMYQVYHKNSKATSVKNWGYDVIFDDDRYKVEQGIVNELSDKIDEARKTINKTVRTALYKQALDLVMELAVELPTYQRNDLVVYNKDLIDVTSINQNPTYLSGVFDKLWLVDFN